MVEFILGILSTLFTEMILLAIYTHKVYGGK
jgi:hypothetical protein